jgi:hypothetical protein
MFTCEQVRKAVYVVGISWFRTFFTFPKFVSSLHFFFGTRSRARPFPFFPHSRVQAELRQQAGYCRYEITSRCAVTASHTPVIPRHEHSAPVGTRQCRPWPSIPRPDATRRCPLRWDERQAHGSRSSVETLAPSCRGRALRRRRRRTQHVARSALLASLPMFSLAHCPCPARCFAPVRPSGPGSSRGALPADSVPFACVALKAMAARRTRAHPPSPFIFSCSASWRSHHHSTAKETPICIGSYCILLSILLGMSG